MKELLKGTVRPSYVSFRPTNIETTIWLFDNERQSRPNWTENFQQNFFYLSEKMFKKFHILSFLYILLYSELLMISYFLFIKFIKILSLKICSKIVSYTLASYFRISAVEMVQIGLSLTEILNQMRRKFSIKFSQISMIYYDSTIKGRQFIYFTVKYCGKKSFLTSKWQYIEAFMTGAFLRKKMWICWVCSVCMQFCRKFDAERSKFGGWRIFNVGGLIKTGRR